MADTHHGKLGAVLATLVVTTTMVGSGIFLLPESLGSVGSISILSWFAATFGALLIGGVFCWLIVLSPGTTRLMRWRERVRMHRWNRHG